MAYELPSHFILPTSVHWLVHVSQCDLESGVSPIPASWILAKSLHVSRVSVDTGGSLSLAIAHGDILRAVVEYLLAGNFANMTPT